ncbi:hypothetical protein HDF14_005042 [Edaphobacter lichenicola]|uniref:Uncharacterized protein n=1 Tax=Tunturiibacter gelidiferens TaxID=3069689 RepID=A0A9X0QJI8_9BACT|nr:hypothetical protein [Edaphobacter lichenicola]
MICSSAALASTMTHYLFPMNGTYIFAKVKKMSAVAIAN